MQNVFFSGSKRKIGRANDLIKELKTVIDRYIEKTFCGPEVVQGGLGVHVLTFAASDLGQEDISLVLGDAIHNLRAALDLAVCDMVTLRGHDPSKQTCFPISDTRKKLENWMKEHLLKDVGPDTYNLILDEIKPYPGGSDLLYGLHVLAIQNKHLSELKLIPDRTVSNVSMVISGASGSGSKMTFQNCSFDVGQGDGPPYAIYSPHAFGVRFENPPTFQVLFGKGPAFEGESLFPKLEELSVLVEGVVNKFEELHLASVKPPLR